MAKLFYFLIAIIWLILPVFIIFLDTNTQITIKPNISLFYTNPFLTLQLLYSDLICNASASSQLNL